MELIKIKKRIKLDDIETLYKELYEKIRKNDTIDLLLPKELENYYMGLIPALYQFVITWARNINSGKLLIDIDNPEDVNFEKLYENELLFPLVSLVWNTNGVFNKDGLINLRKYLIVPNKNVFAKMQSVKTLKGNKLLLTAFDHLPEKRGILPCFEISSKFIVDESKLKDSLKQAIKDVLNYSKAIDDNYKKVDNELIGIIYELMKNTFEWAKENENGVQLDPNIRGLLMRFYKKKRQTLLNDFKNHLGLYEYFKSEILKENSQNELYFLEISVFDSGIGFVEKYKSLNDDRGLSNIDIVKKCMIKHNTSAITIDKDDKGIGLDRILTILDRKGFLRIKTNDVCLYRNLISHNYKEIKEKITGQMELFDWYQNSNSEYSSFEASQGSVVTIVYPLSIQD